MATGRLFRSGLFLFVIAVLTTDLSADVITIGASKDNTIFQSNVANSLGGGQAMFVGTNNTPSPRRGRQAPVLTTPHDDGCSSQQLSPKA